jgi:biopolymer transport protein ExbB/TolQ
MSRPARSMSEMKAKGSFVNWFTFAAGVPVGLGAIVLVSGPLGNETIKRYVQHEAEQAVVVLFCCCIAALFAKVLVCIKERYVQAQTILPSWDGKQVPVAEVAALQQSLNLVWDKVKNSYMGRRIANILNFVESRGSANELDDQIRTLADNDAMALDGSYELMRFIIWAIPILGFLGTVLGITEAISGISPEQLEKGADAVAGGLTKAFDATALALSLTLVAMFFNFLVGRLENGLMQSVDLYADEELAHRFLRTGPEATATPAAGLDQLLEKQASRWASSMEVVEQHWSQAGSRQAEVLAVMMKQVLEGSLTRHAQMLADMEKKLVERQQIVNESLAKTVAGMKEMGKEHHLALARLTDAIGRSVETITKVQANEAQLNRLQETLTQNLTILANSATFEQAVQSLTAAIHLITTRVSPAGPTTAGLRILPKHDAA